MTSGVTLSREEMAYIKARVLDYFARTPGGTFAAACKSADLPHSTAYDWRKADPEFDAAVISARKVADELGGDFAESKLMEAIRDNELTGIIFYLKTKHKNRGYVERQEQSGPNGGPIAMTNSTTTVVELEGKSLDELTRLFTEKLKG